MTWVRERFRYQKIAEEIEPASVVTTRDSWVWTAIWVLGVTLSLGLLAWKMPLRVWLEDVAAAVGPWQGYARRLTELRKSRIAHESRHTRQCVFFGWIFAPIAWVNRRFRAVLGLLPFLLVYFVLPLPIGFSGKFWLELDADRAAWRLSLREGWMTPGEVLVRAGQKAERISRGIYLFAWPRSWASRSYERMARELVHEATR